MMATRRVAAWRGGEVAGVPGYEVEGELGRGGAGVVFRARQTRLDRLVALKLPLDRLPSAITNARFLREIRALRGLRHPHVVRVLDSGQFAGRWFYTMELLEGPTLGELAQRAGGLETRRALALVRQAAEALAASHAAGLLHRDVKPANMLVSEGDHLTLVDFGMVLDPEAKRVTTVGKVIGTPLYVAPELLEGAPATPASDVFALGLTLFQALTGRSPYPALPLLELMDEIVDRGPVAVHERRPDVPEAVHELMLAMVARDPAERPAAAEVAQRLGGRRRPARGRLRKPAVVSAARGWCALIGALLGALAWALYKG